MRAAQFDRYGEPAQVPKLREVPVPDPLDEQVHVRILASPINLSDLLFLRGFYAGVQPSFPAPAGFEGVGLVDALGRHTQGFVHGQRVAVINEKGGNWAEYAVVPENRLFLVPDDLSTEQVASFFINPASAIDMVRHVLAIPRGSWLLQSAAGPELGRFLSGWTRSGLSREETGESISQTKGANSGVVGHKARGRYCLRLMGSGRHGRLSRQTGTHHLLNDKICYPKWIIVSCAFTQPT